jgi:undecaprenyl-diphosphatase
LNRGSEGPISQVGLQGRKILHRASANWSRAHLIVLAAIAFVAGAVWVFVEIADNVLEGDTQAFDTAMIMALRTPGNPQDPIGPDWLEEMGRDVTALGSYAFLTLLLVCVVAFFLLIRKRGAALLMAGSVLGGMALSTLLKTVIDRPRPDLTQTARVFTASFPSGHATLSAVTFLTLGVLLTKMERQRHVQVFFLGLAVLLTGLVGLSRLYLGVHYPTDILAGWCLGAAWAIFCALVAEWLQRRGKVEQPIDSAN